jgi:hypothetical protein
MTTWRRFRRYAVALLLLCAFALAIWASDRITLQGERTVYTVNCEQGEWQGTRCTGKLVPGPRYAFRASTLRQEVIYWIRGSKEPSGRYADCTVIDRDNWTCNEQSGQQPSVAYEFDKGRPTKSDDGKMIPFHDVPKWKWWLMKMGIGAFRST